MKKIGVLFATAIVSFLFFSNSVVATLDTFHLAMDPGYGDLD